MTDRKAAVLYRDDDLVVQSTEISWSETVVVTFTPWDVERRDSSSDQGFAHALLEQHSISSIRFISTCNHWFETTSLEAAVAAVCALPSYLAKKRRVLYGGSMGGYGAALVCNKISATKLLLACPQLDIGPDSFEDRWLSERSKIRIVYGDACAQVNGFQGPISVIVDPSFEPDLRHLKLVDRPFRLIPSSGEHHVLRELAARGQLRDIVLREVLED